MSRASCHILVPHVMCHMACVNFVLVLSFFFFFFWKNGAASRLRVCYQWGLPRLVYKNSVNLFCLSLYHSVSSLFFHWKSRIWETLNHSNCVDRRREKIQSKKSGVTCHVLCITYHMSQTPTAKATHPLPAYFPTMHSRMGHKDPNIKEEETKSFHVAL